MLSLAFLGEGNRARIIRVLGGRGMVGRLTTMGLLPGREVVVVRNQMAGPLIVSVRGSQLALGRGLAMRILVEVEK